MNITLIGMPGSGKSSVGQALAELLALNIIDLDREMEKVHGVTLQELVDEWGDDAFLEKEADFAIIETEGAQDLIISPGGSIVYSPRAMDHFDNMSHIVYLEAPLSVIEERVGKAPPRGIVGLKAKPLADLYRERCELYERYAHDTFDGTKDAEVLAKEIAEAIKRGKKQRS